MEEFELIGGKKVFEIINKHIDYRLFVRIGFAFRGAEMKEDDKQDKEMYMWREGRSRIVTFAERVKSLCEHYCAYDVTISHENKTLYINAFTESDMY